RLEDLDARANHVAELHRAKELDVLGQVDGARPGQPRPDHGGDQARRPDSRGDWLLELRCRRVRRIGVHGIVVADRLDEAGDVGVGGPTRDLRPVTDLDDVDRETDHARAALTAAVSSRSSFITASRRSSRPSTLSSSCTICAATPITWLRDGRPRPASPASICCSAAFLTGPEELRKLSICLPMAWAKVS